MRGRGDLPTRVAGLARGFGLRSRHTGAALAKGARPASSGARRAGRGAQGTPRRARGEGLRELRGGRGRGASGVSPRALEGGGKRALRAGRGLAARGELAMPELGRAGSDTRCLTVFSQHFAQAALYAMRASARRLPSPLCCLARGPDAPGPPPLPLPAASPNSASRCLFLRGYLAEFFS